MPKSEDRHRHTDVAGGFKEIKAGQVEFRTDKDWIVHVRWGSFSFVAEVGRQRETVITMSSKATA